MKKSVKILLPLLFAALFAAIFALTGSAETGRYEIYMTSDAALSAQWTAEGKTVYAGMKEAMTGLKDVVAAAEINGAGNLVTDGGEREIWILADGVVSPYTDTQNSTSFCGGTAHNMRGLNGNQPLIHITSADVSDPANYATLEYKTTGQSFLTLRNNFHLEKINVVTRRTVAGTAYQAQIILNEATKFSVGEGVTFTAYNGNGVALAAGMRLWAGSNLASAAAKNVEITILSGKWDWIYMVGTYQPCDLSGQNRFTFGGTAEVGTLAGLSGTTHNTDLNIPSAAAGGERLTGSVDLAVTVTGGKIGTYCGYFGASNFAEKEARGNISTTVSGGEIASFTGGSAFGTLTGSVTNTISGGTITVFYGGVGSGALSGGVTNTVTGGSVTNFYGAGDSGTVAGPVENRFDMGASRIYSACGGANKNGEVSGSITNLLLSGVFGHFRGAGYLDSVSSGGVLNRFEGTDAGLKVENYCSGGLGTVSGAVTYLDGEGAEYSGAVINRVTGGTLGGVQSGTNYYGFTGTEAATRGNVVNLITGGVFGDFYGAGRGANKVTGDVINLISDAEMQNFTGSSRNGNTDGEISTQMERVVLTDYYGAGAKTVTGSVTNTLLSVTAAHLYGGSNTGGVIEGDVFNLIEDCTVTGAVYGAGKGARVGSETAPAKVTNAVRADSGASSLIANFYGGLNSADGVIFGSVENTLENLAAPEGNVAGGCFAGTVTGDVTTSVSGENTEIRSFLAAGLRLKENGVGGGVSATLTGGRFETVNAHSSVTGEYVAESGASLYEIVVDLTEGDVSFRSAIRDGARVELIGGAGTLTLGETGRTLTLAEVSGTPRVTLDAPVTFKTYLVLPEGKGETDVIFTAEGPVWFTQGAFRGFSTRPVGCTLLLQEDGRFAIRYLYGLAEIRAWESASGATALFQWSRGGSDPVIAEPVDVVIDGVEYRSFVVSGIPAKAAGDPVTVTSTVSSEPDVYSVAAACRDVIETGEDPAFTAFAKALLDYARAAYDYFDYAGTEPSAAFYTDLQAEGYADPYRDLYARSGAPGAAAVRGTSVVLKDAIELKFYVSLEGDPSLYRARINGRVREDALVKNGPYYTVTYRVPVHELDDPVTVVIVDGAGAPVSDFYQDSVVSYCAFVAGRAGEEDEKLVALCRYIQAFVLASSDYFDASPLYSSDPLAAYAALPVGKPGMTEAELRRVALAYMTLQQSLIWTPDATFTYDATNISKTITLTAGVPYAGMPYSAAGQDLPGFLEYYDPATGTVAVSGAANPGAVFGNHCTTSCFWAWSRFSSAVVYQGNAGITLPNGFYPVGDYTGTDVARFSEDHGTKEVCEENGRQTMFEAYARVLPADAILTFKTGGTGHVRMVMAEPVVVRNGDGIDGALSCLTVVEQVSAENEAVVPSGESVVAIGNVGKVYTFDQLFNTSYVPFTIPEFAGQAQVEFPEVTFTFGAETTLSALLSGSLSSNYALSRAEAVILDADGEEVARFAVQGYGSDIASTGKSARRIKVSQLFTARDLAALPSGAYTAVFSLRLGNGEVWDGYTFSFTK